ncbi:MAG: VOC family protein [Pseudomonadota bacterium]
MLGLCEIWNPGLAIWQTGWIHARSFVLSLFRRSFKRHASIRVSNLPASLAFYRQLGFHVVTATRSSEVTLLRNHRGDELNLVVIGPGNTPAPGAVVSWQIPQLSRELDRLQGAFPELNALEDATSRRLRLTDPDGNVVEFYELLKKDAIATTQIFHIVTRQELLDGLSEHYYMPPHADNRFVRARPRAAILAIVCERVNNETQAPALIVQLDESALDIEAQLVDEGDFDNPAEDRSPYPRVAAPITRQALTGVGIVPTDGGADAWPLQFVSVQQLVESGQTTIPTTIPPA